MLDPAGRIRKGKATACMSKFLFVFSILVYATLKVPSTSDYLNAYSITILKAYRSAMTDFETKSIFPAILKRTNSYKYRNQHPSAYKKTVLFSLFFKHLSSDAEIFNHSEFFPITNSSSIHFLYKYCRRMQEFRRIRHFR